MEMIKGWLSGYIDLPFVVIVTFIGSAIYRFYKYYKRKNLHKFTWSGKLDSHGNMHGKGICRWRTGRTYEGNMKNGKMHGKGKFSWGPKQCYEGDFVEGIITGKGTEKYANGMSYTGQFVNGERHGKGIMKYKDGREYRGQFQRSKKHGTGVWQLENGDKYVGSFRNGKMHGAGKLVISDKPTYGYWEYGEKIQNFSTLAEAKEHAKTVEAGGSQEEKKTNEKKED